MLFLFAFPLSALGAALTSPKTTTCMTGKPTTTAGFPILYYTPVTPVATASFASGYEPMPKWASRHLVGTYTFGVPEPTASGFAYAQFKCQYYCVGQSQSQGGGGSFFVRGDREVGSYCNCYDELVDPESFVDANQTLVGAWNILCRQDTGYKPPLYPMVPHD